MKRMLLVPCLVLLVGCGTGEIKPSPVATMLVRHELEIAALRSNHDKGLGVGVTFANEGGRMKVTFHGSMVHLDTSVFSDINEMQKWFEKYWEGAWPNLIGAARRAESLAAEHGIKFDVNSDLTIKTHASLMNTQQLSSIWNVSLVGEGKLDGTLVWRTPETQSFAKK